MFGAVSCVDYGDAPTVPGYIEDTLERIEAYARPIARGRAQCRSGSAATTRSRSPSLRAAAKAHGPLGLVHLDSHHDVWDSYFGRPLQPRHGVPARLRGGPARPGPLRAGRHARGAVRRGRLRGIHASSAWRSCPGASCARLGPEAYGERVRARVAAGGPTYLTFDVDFVDPAFCPGTGTPEIGGPTSAEALDFVRALRGIDLRAFDVVEVAPAYDGPGQVTALLAASVMYELLTLVALRR